MQQDPPRPLPIALKSKHFKRKACITEKSGHLQPSTNQGFVAVLLIFSNWLQSPLTSWILSAIMMGKACLAQRTATRLTGDRKWGWTPHPATSQLCSLGLVTWLRTPLSLSIKQGKRQDLRPRVTLRIKGGSAYEALSAVSDTHWVFSRCQPRWPQIWQVALLLSAMKWRPAQLLTAGQPVLTWSYVESRALQTHGCISITQSSSTSSKVVNTDLRGWPCPQVPMWNDSPILPRKP